MPSVPTTELDDAVRSEPSVAPGPSLSRVVSATRSRALPALILLIAWASVVIPYFPGHLSNDILSMTSQAQAGQINDHHAPVLLWLWSEVWPLGVGVGWLLMLQVATFVGGLFLVQRAVLSSLSAAVAVLVITVSPAVYGMLAWVLRDNWFLAGLLCTFGALITAQRSAGWTRVVWLIAAVPACWATIATRQNAVSATVVATAAMVAIWLAGRRGVDGRLPGRLRRVPFGVVTIVGGVVASLVLLASQLAAVAAINPDRTYPEAYVYIYDLAALSVRHDTNLLPASVMPARDPSVVKRFFSPDDVVPMAFLADSPIEPEFDATEVADLRSAWIAALRNEPGEYLTMRWDLYLRQIGVSRPPVWIFHPGIDPNTLGLARRFPALDDAATGYVKRFGDRNLYGTTPLHLPWIYLAMCAVGSVLLLRARDTLQKLVGALALAVLLYQVSLFFLAMGVQFRFEFPAVVVGMVVCLALVRSAVNAVGSRRRVPTGETT